MRRQAQDRKISLNQLVLEELIRSTGVTTGRALRSLKSIAGRWKKNPAFDRGVEEQRPIDWNLWR